MADLKVITLPEAYSAEEALDDAKIADLDSVVICGINKDGTLYVGSNQMRLVDAVGLLATGQHALIGEMN